MLNFIKFLYSSVMYSAIPNLGSSFNLMHSSVSSIFMYVPSHTNILPIHVWAIPYAYTSSLYTYGLPVHIQTGPYIYGSSYTESQISQENLALSICILEYPTMRVYAWCSHKGRDQPIMLLVLPIMLCLSALKIYLLCSRTGIVVRILCYLYTSYMEQTFEERLFY